MRAVQGSGGADPSLVLFGHGTRSALGASELWELVAQVRALQPTLQVSAGYIEHASPTLDEALEQALVAGCAGASGSPGSAGAPGGTHPSEVVAVPLVLFPAGHLKDDGPAALHRARSRHPLVRFSYARELGTHPLVLELAERRIRACLSSLPGKGPAAVVLVGRGSTDPAANADLYRVARLLADSRKLGTLGGEELDVVEPAFVSLAPPAVPAALERARLLGARRIAVVPYFLFHGVLIERIADQATTWSAEAGVEVALGSHLGPERSIALLVLERYAEAVSGRVPSSCDCCTYRCALPGHPQRHARAGTGERGPRQPQPAPGRRLR